MKVILKRAKEIHSAILSGVLTEHEEEVLYKEFDILTIKAGLKPILMKDKTVLRLVKLSTGVTRSTSVERNLGTVK